MVSAVLHATQRELHDLWEAVSNHCTCRLGGASTRAGLCAAHRMLLEDQRAVSGLLYVRRVLLPRLLEEEFAPETS